MYDTAKRTIKMQLFPSNVSLYMVLYEIVWVCTEQLVNTFVLLTQENDLFVSTQHISSIQLS